jgi:uncharacterized protein (TIGR00251 family)
LESQSGNKLDIRRSAEGIIFKIFVQPKSSKNLVVGLHGDALKIKLTAPPVDNAANRKCIKFLAKALMVPKSAIDIIAGHTSRNKQVLLKSPRENLSGKEYQRLERLVENLMSPDSTKKD